MLDIIIQKVILFCSIFLISFFIFNHYYKNDNKKTNKNILYVCITKISELNLLELFFIMFLILYIVNITIYLTVVILLQMVNLSQVISSEFFDPNLGYLFFENTEGNISGFNFGNIMNTSEENITNISSNASSTTATATSTATSTTTSPTNKLSSIIKNSQFISDIDWNGILTQLFNLSGNSALDLLFMLVLFKKIEVLFLYLLIYNLIIITIDTKRIESYFDKYPKLNYYICKYINYTKNSSRVIIICSSLLLIFSNYYSLFAVNFLFENFDKIVEYYLKNKN
jgi:hypothetical protein